MRPEDEAAEQVDKLFAEMLSGSLTHRGDAEAAIHRMGARAIPRLVELLSPDTVPDKTVGCVIAILRDLCGSARVESRDARFGAPVGQQIRREMASRALALLDDPAAIGPLLDALPLEGDGTPLAPEVSDSLARLLVHIEASGRIQQLDAIRQMRLHHLIRAGSPRRHLGLLVAALTVVARTGDITYLSDARRIAPAAQSGETGVRGAALACVQVLARLKSEQEAGRMLLRPADPPAVDSGRLVRPAGPPTGDPDCLLRPTIPPGNR